MTVDSLLKEAYCESDFDSVEGLGAWFDPANPSRKVPGLFFFQNEAQCNLVLHGALDTESNEGRSRDFPVICGEVDAGHSVTVFDCVFKSYTIIGGRESSIRIEYVYGDSWFGGRTFASKSDVAFKEVTFGINNLNWWVGDQVYEHRYEDIHNVTISVDAASVFKLFEDEYVEAVIQHEPVVESTNAGKLSPGFTDHIRVCIRSKAGVLSFYGDARSFEYYIYRLYQFLVLLVGINPYIYDIRGYGGDFRSGCYQFRVRRDVQLDKMDKKYDTTAVLLPRSVLGDVDYVAIIEKYFQIYNEISTGLTYLAAFSTRTIGYARNILPEAIYNFEGIEDALYKEENEQALRPALNAENQRILDSIMRVCNNSQKEFLANRFKPRGATLKWKLQLVMDKLSATFPYVVNREDALASFLVRARNGFSHRGDGSFDDRYLYVGLVEFMNLLTVSMVLSECGVPIERLSACLNRDGGAGVGPKINIERCFPLHT